MGCGDDPPQASLYIFAATPKGVAGRDEILTYFCRFFSLRAPASDADPLPKDSLKLKKNRFRKKHILSKTIQNLAPRGSLKSSKIVCGAVFSAS